MTPTKTTSTRRPSMRKLIAGLVTVLTGGSLTVWFVTGSKAHAQAQAQANPSAVAATGPNSNTGNTQSGGNAVAQIIMPGAQSQPSRPQDPAQPKPAPLTQKEIQLEAQQLLYRAIADYPTRYHGVEVGMTYSGCTHRYKAMQEEAVAALNSIHVLGLAANQAKIADAFVTKMKSGPHGITDTCGHTLAYEK